MSTVYGETLNVLTSLPLGSVVLDGDGDAWQRTPGGWTCVVRGANTKDMDASSLAILSPITPIHRAPHPDETASEVSS